MTAEPIERYILKSEHNLRIAAEVAESWMKARRSLVTTFLDRLDSLLKKKLRGWKFEREGTFFEDSNPGYYFWKSTWNNYSVGFQCHTYGEQIVFGVFREGNRFQKQRISEELLNALRKFQPTVRVNAWWLARMIMAVPEPDWRNPEELWQMHKDTKFLRSVAEQLLEVAKISAPIVDRLERRKK